MSTKSELVVIDALKGRSAIEVCLEILRGKYLGIFEYGSSDYRHYFIERFLKKTDDREIQMAACYYLAENAEIGDKNIINVLLSKISDERSVTKFSQDDDDPERFGSCFSIGGCAADALAALTDWEADLDLVPLNTVHENIALYWVPRKIEVKNGVMYLSSDKLCGRSTGIPSSYYLRTTRLVYFCGCGASHPYYTVYCKKCRDDLECVGIPCGPTLRRSHAGK